MYSVYKHECPDGKVYIGATSLDVEARWGRNGILYKGGTFWNAIERYGWDNIKHEILFCGLTKEQAVKKETEMILAYKSNQKEFGYNIFSKGSIHKHTEETKAKMSASRKGRTPSEPHRKALSKALTGKKVSEETITKLRMAHLGKTLTKEQKVKISRGCKGKGVKAVIQLDMDGKVLKVFPSIVDAARSISEKAVGSNISMCCSGKRPMAYGFRWEYANEDQPINGS